jgi:signal transduction histidine kinase
VSDIVSQSPRNWKEPKVRSLYWKVSAVLLLLLLVLAVVQRTVWDRASMGFMAETDQKLNQTLAADLAKRFSPFMADSLDYAAIEYEFHELMVMNPRVEIYLVDRKGDLLAYFADPSKIKRMRVDVAPIHQYTKDQTERLPFPIYGDDPRSPDRRKPFSAVPVSIGGKGDGYLYVILGGEQYESTSSMVAESYILRSNAWMLLGTFGLAAVSGLILFFWVTSRLRTMTGAVRQFSTGDHDARVTVASEDEIGQLGTAFNQMADTITENVRRLKANDDLRRELIANVSHDLRSPLANIQGYLETVLMKEETLTPQQRREYLDTALGNVQMLSRLVTELFELSKLDARQMQPEREPFSIAELAQDTTLKFQPRAEESAIKLKVDVPRDLPLVYGDIGMIDRALSNLLENALRYSKAEGEVTISVSPEIDGIGVSVSDTGDGIPAEDLPYIFDRFYRVEKSRNKAEGGTGLGLAIAKKIVELHDSTISVQSALRQGTTFSFSLTPYQEATA